MVSNLVVYQLALIALVWLFLMLAWLWPSEPAAARPLPPTPVTPPRKRSTAPKPFTGFIRKPHCHACEPTIQARRLPQPSAPPPKIISTRGRRRYVDTSRHFCPDADCRYGGWVGLGNLQAKGHPSGGPWTPAMAAGLTHHVWTLRAVLLFRGPPWPQPASLLTPRLVGSRQRRGPEQVPCVHMARCEGFTRAQKAAGRP
jgi:hypothetical protein